MMELTVWPNGMPVFVIPNAEIMLTSDMELTRTKRDNLLFSELNNKYFPDKGEKIAGLWATPRIPDIGIYKLTAKKRLDGKFEWVHFQHRPDDTRKVLLRGEVASKGLLGAVLSVTNSTLSRVYGVVMQAAEFYASTTDGGKFGGPVQ